MQVIKSGREIGLSPTNKYIWIACINCGIERWVRIERGQPRSQKCIPCALTSPEKREAIRRATKGRWWKRETRIKDRRGYILVRLHPGDPFYSMATKAGLVCEHRLVMAKHIGRDLRASEVVHHKNGVRDDNRAVNLQILTDIGHKIITTLEVKNARLEERIKDLEHRVLLLEAEKCLTCSQ